MEKKDQALLLTAVLKFLLQMLSMIPYALFAMGALAWGIVLFVLYKDILNTTACPAQHMINLVLASAVSFPVVFVVLTVVPFCTFGLLLFFTFLFSGLIYLVVIKLILAGTKRDTCGSSSYIPSIGIGFLVLLAQICLSIILIVLTFAKSCAKFEDTKIFYTHMAAYSICCTVFIGIGFICSGLFQAFIPIIPDSAFAKSIEKKLSNSGSGNRSTSIDDVKYKPIKNFDVDDD